MEASVIVKWGEIAYCKLEDYTCFECSKAYAKGIEVNCEIKKEFDRGEKK